MMMIIQKALLMIISMSMCTGQGEDWYPMESIINQIVAKHFFKCQLVLLIPKTYTPILLGALRQAREGVMVLQTSSDHHLIKRVLEKKSPKCRILVFQVSEANNRTEELSMIEDMGLWKMPETRVLIVGEPAMVEFSLLHQSLRNIIDCVYIAVHHSPASNIVPIHIHRWNYKTLSQATITEVSVYRRCLFCKSGNKGIHHLGHMDISLGFHLDNLFIDSGNEMRNLKGHIIKVVAAPYFPYIAYVRDRNEPGTIVTPTYSVDAYLMSTFATHLNFTYIMREEPEGKWGLEKNGMFNGMIGQLQREEVDFCTIAGPSPGRLRVIGFLRTYPSDLMTVVTLKPSLLPQQLSIIRPFSGMVWGTVFTCMAVWGAVLWTLHQAFRRFATSKNVQLNTALLYGWGSLLEESMESPFINVSAQIMVGFWLLFSLIITSSFKSSLIAHLTIQGKSDPPDTLAELVNSENWGWAIEPWLLNGVPLEYLSKHPDPIVQTIHKEKQVLWADEALKKVLKGQFALLNLEKYITIIIKSRYSDKRGSSPFQISKKAFSIMAVFGWGVRKGAPYYQRFQQLIGRLEDSGIIEYWTKEVIIRNVKEKRNNAEASSYYYTKDFSDDSLLQVSFGLKHLQGAFYILLIGSGVAFLSVSLEILTVKQWTTLPFQ